MMRILILNNRYPTLQKPYVASWLKIIYEEVKDCFNEVDLLVGTRNSSGKPGLILDIFMYWIKVLFSLKIARSEVLFLHHFNMYWPVLKLRVGKQKLLIHWHGSELKSGSGFSRPSPWNRDRRLKSATHIAPSYYYKKLIQEYLPALTKIHVIPSGGIDTALFKPVVKEGNRSEWVIGFASQLSYAKGVELFLELARNLDSLLNDRNVSIKLTAIDYGASNQEITDELRALGVELVQPMDKQMLPEYYSSLDILLFPSHHESLGLVPLEAMACGIPVVCPDAFSAPEYCRPGKSGELFKPRDYQSFREAILKVLKNYNGYTTREIILKNYSREVARNAYQNLISSL